MKYGISSKVFDCKHILKNTSLCILMGSRDSGVDIQIETPNSLILSFNLQFKYFPDQKYICCTEK